VFYEIEYNLVRNSNKTINWIVKDFTFVDFTFQSDAINIMDRKENVNFNTSWKYGGRKLDE